MIRGVSVWLLYCEDVVEFGISGEEWLLLSYASYEVGLGSGRVKYMRMDGHGLQANTTQFYNTKRVAAGSLIARLQESDDQQICPWSQLNYFNHVSIQ